MISVSTGVIGAAVPQQTSPRARAGTDLRALIDERRRAAPAVLSIDEAGTLAAADRLLDALFETLLPPELPTVPFLDIAARFLPTTGGDVVVGDFYDVFRCADDAWGIVLGDVSGHGIEAAALAVVARHTVRTACRMFARGKNRPLRALTALNQTLLLRREEMIEGPETERMVTATALVATATDLGVTIDISSAGHVPTLWCRKGEPARFLPLSGTILGQVPDEMLRLRIRRLHVKPGDTLVLYTDGVTEARHTGEFFGEDRLRRVVDATRDVSAAELARRIEAEVLAFTKGHLRDDMAVLVVQADPPPAMGGGAGRG